MSLRVVCDVVGCKAMTVALNDTASAPPGWRGLSWRQLPAEAEAEEQVSMPAMMVGYLRAAAKLMPAMPPYRMIHAAVCPSHDLPRIQPDVEAQAFNQIYCAD